MRQRELAELDVSQYYQVRTNCSCSINSEAHVCHMQSFIWESWPIAYFLSMTYGLFPTKNRHVAFDPAHIGNVQTCPLHQPPPHLRVYISCHHYSDCFQKHSPWKHRVVTTHAKFALKCFYCKAWGIILTASFLFVSVWSLCLCNKTLPSAP